MTNDTRQSLGKRLGLSDRLLERFLTNDLPAEEQRCVQTVIDASPELTAYVAERRQDQAAFASTHPFSPIRARLEAQTAPAERRAFAWLRPVLAAGALVIAVTIGVALLRPERATIRVRGGVSATLVVKRQARVFEAVAGVPLKPGDQLRVRVDDPEGGLLYLLGLDEHGAVTWYVGGNGPIAAVRADAGTTTLPGSLTLDDSAMQEALILVLAKEPLTAAALKDWLKAAPPAPSFPPQLAPLAGARTLMIPISKDLP